VPEQPADKTKIDITFPEAYKLYEDGKHRRYELLFAVNGGAFAIAKLIGEKPGLGSLRLSYVALGMVLFTITMVYDIYQFGKKWHAIGERFKRDDKDQLHTIFGSPGRRVIIIIGALICLGWTFVSGLF
jgi:hypothetical protein